MKAKRKIVLLFGGILAVMLIACTVYVSDYYEADVQASEVFAADEQIEVETNTKGDFIVAPENATTGFIFYPGGKVEHTAYLPLMKELAEEGIFCVLVKMPLKLAAMDMDAADTVMESYPQIEHWYIGGHSHGGAMASSYLEETADAFEGLVLLAAYSITDLTETDLKVLSVLGSEDQVLNHENYEENKENLPETTRELEIEGGCHAYFGMYGVQKGDGTPTITNEEQIAVTADAIAEMINQ